jgi:hypothetical protein
LWNRCSLGIEKPSNIEQEKLMEIHAPDKPIHSKKEFLFHMFTVVLGILIALAMEAGVEWFHHRALVREARENILAEVRKNKETVNESIQEIHQREAELDHIIDLMHKVESDRNAIKNQSMHFGVTMHDLYSTAWQTATSSGAVTYMKYDELIQYTDLYLTQLAFTSLQEQALNRMIEGGSLIEVTMKEEDMKRSLKRALNFYPPKPGYQWLRAMRPGLAGSAKL